MRRWAIVTALVTSLLGCTPLASASVVPSLTTTISMDCRVVLTACAFDPGSQGSPEQGMANFNPVDPGWSAGFDSAPAISWGIFLGVYQAQFGTGGSFTVNAPSGLQLSGMVTSGVAFCYQSGYAQTVAWFQGTWNNGLNANGLMIGNSLGDQGWSTTLVVTTTSTPEPGSFLLFGSALAGLAGMFRRTLR